jgi:iron complex transport system ATP-binding protein
MIGRALVHQPQMLLLDEPSNALDLFAQHELRDTLRRLAREGIGLIMVTHHLPDIIPEIARVVMMRDGRIVADGAKAELLTVARLGSLFGVQLELHQRDGYYHVA